MVDYCMQLIKWCGGRDFDGCLLFDESHKAKNLKIGCFDAKGNVQQGSKTAKAVYTIQVECPLARVVYCSATGASEPSNVAFI